MARDTNDYLADAVRKHPKRFAGLAAVPTGAPKQAVEELEGRVRQGFKGLVINGHNRGRYLDDQFYWPILECAEALNVCINLEGYAEKITCPMLVVHGGRDIVTPIDNATRLMHEARGEIETLIWDDSMHCCHDRSHIVRPRMADFMARRL